MDNYFNKEYFGKNMANSCPAKGMDSRHLTTYISQIEVAEIIKSRYNLKNNYEYTLFIQKNGSKIIEVMQEYHRNNSACFPNICTNNFETNISIKEMKEQMDAYNNKWNPNYTKNKGCVKQKEYSLN